MRNELRTSLVLFSKLRLIDAVKPHVSGWHVTIVFLLTFFSILVKIIIFSYYGKRIWSYVLHYYLLCQRGKKNTLMSFFDGLGLYVFRQKMRKTRPVREEMDREVLNSSRKRKFSFVNNLIKVLFPIYTSAWRVNCHVSRQGTGVNRRNESTIITNNISYCWSSCFKWYLN